MHQLPAVIIASSEIRLNLNSDREGERLRER